MTETVGDFTNVPLPATVLQTRRIGAGVQIPASVTGEPVNANAIAYMQVLDARERGWNGILTASNAPTTKPAKSGASNDLANKTGGNVTDKELKQIFGSNAGMVRSLLNTRSDISVGELAPLAHDGAALSAVCALLTRRTDINIGDVLQKGQDGQVHLSGVASDPASRELLMKRTDIKPGDLEMMGKQIANVFQNNAAMARKAYGQAIDLLKTRTDLRPGDVVNLLTHLNKGVSNTKDGAKGGQAKDMAMSDMFDKSLKLLKERPDVGVDDVNKLIDKTSTQFGGKQDDNGLSNMKDAFDTATDMLLKNKDMPIQKVLKVMDAVDNHFGSDHDNKLDAFKSAANLMTRMPQLDADGIGTMLQKASEGPPPLKGDKLAQAFQDTAQDVIGGRIDPTTATTPRAQLTGTQLRADDAEHARINVQIGKAPTAAQQQKAEADEERQERLANSGVVTPSTTGAKPSGGAHPSTIAAAEPAGSPPGAPGTGQQTTNPGEKVS